MPSSWGTFHDLVAGRSRGRHRLWHWNFRARPMGQPRQGRARQGQLRLFPRIEVAAMVGDRRVADRRQHLRRADRRHERLGLCNRPRDRIVRVDGGADAADRRQVFSADLSRQRDLHDAAVPRAAVRPTHPDADGGVLARPVRLRQPDVDHLARLDRRQSGCRYRSGYGAGRARAVRLALPVARVD